MNQTKIKQLAALLVFFTAASSQAQWYLGASVGHAEVEESSFDSGTSIRLAAGYRFIDYFGLEFAVAQLGAFDGENNERAEFDVQELSAVGLWPIGGAFGMHVRLGVFNWKSEVSGNIVDLKDNEDGELDLVSALGFSYTFEDQGAVTLEASYYDIDSDSADAADIDINLLAVSFGIEAHF